MHGADELAIMLREMKVITETAQKKKSNQQ
jgi:hypothetical protein